MNRLITLAGAFLVGCSPVTQQQSQTTTDGAFQPFVVGTEADIQKASVLAQTCKLQGIKVGKLKGYPALYLNRIGAGSISPLSPAWECFIVGLGQRKFSDQLGFIGREVDQPK